MSKTKAPRDQTGRKCTQKLVKNHGCGTSKSNRAISAIGAPMRTVLFLCTHNSARSQMAEAFLNHLCGDRFRAESAGITPTQINPYVARVMSEIGIPLTGHRPKSIMEFQGRTFEFVVTVCDQTRESCPFFPGEKEINKSFPDPSAFTGSEQEILAKTRVVRDEIKAWVENTFCKGDPDKVSPMKSLFEG